VKLVVHPLALREVFRIAARYDRERAGLGGEFITEVEDALARIREHPLSGHPLAGGERQALLHRFPHKVVYYPAPDRLYVAAVAHHRRREGYWRKRRFEH
jgi:toxin ParE1/3/4